MRATRSDGSQAPLPRLGIALAVAFALFGGGSQAVAARVTAWPVRVSGMTLDVRAGRVVVTKVAPGSAAAAAGVLPLDSLLVVNDQNLIDLDPASPARVLELFRYGQASDLRLILGRGAGTLGVLLHGRGRGGPAPAEGAEAVTTDPERLQPGSEAPVFSAADLDGQVVSLLELRGRPVLIDFWASWCAPCRDSAITLRRLAVEHAGHLAILGVSLDEDRRAYEAFIHNHHLPGRQIFDGGWSGPISRMYGVSSAGVPYSALVDPAGRIVSMGRSLRDQEEAIVRLAAESDAHPPVREERKPR
jgi:peroxiredoxin